MSTLCDFQIRQLARDTGLIEPYNPEQLNPASYDVTLGNTILLEEREDVPYYEAVEANRWKEFDISETPYMLPPGGFILAVTSEFIRLPGSIEAVFCLKSSRGREGWNHALAAYCDPMFHGRVTLELKNYNQYQHLKVEAGMRIGQLRFSKMDQIPGRPYNLTGRYFGDEGVQISRG
jgi:dCTP deaminase